LEVFDEGLRLKFLESSTSVEIND
jgi:hypothetical protein